MKFVLPTLAALGLVAFAPSVLAQDAAGLRTLGGDSDANEVISGSGLNLGDLIQYAGRAGGISPTDFSRQQQRRLPNEIESFRQRQRDLFNAQPVENSPTADTSDAE